jgi:YD repeat-containing protein
MALLVRCPKCGETKEHPETIVGQVLVCPGCDLKYLVAKQPQRGNYAIVKPIVGSGRAALPPELRGKPTSLAAIASLILGILAVPALFVLGLVVAVAPVIQYPSAWRAIPMLGVPGIVGLALGLFGLRRTAGEVRKGRALAVAGIVTSVCGILLGLAALVAGDAIWDAFAKPDEQTRRTLAALDVALSRYHDDWGKYPWTETTPDGLMGAVDETPKKGLRPAKGTADDAEALLYAALNCRLKRGPYVSGRGLMTTEKEAAGVRYRIYYDGWGRPIKYALPDPGMKKPLLQSLGDDPDDPNSIMTNE